MQTRRTFVEALFAAGFQAVAAGPDRSFVKGICSDVFPRGMPLEDIFKAARSAGFDAIEIRMGEEFNENSTIDEAKRVGDAARQNGIQIAALWPLNGVSRKPLNSPDPSVRREGTAELAKAIRLAKHADCHTLLVVPGRVTWGPDRLGYEVTWQRTAESLRQLLPQAAEAGVTLCVENVWNKFLLSPLEMRRYVDDFQSRWFKAIFDIGNIVQYGFPQDWIHTLGNRIQAVHLKDYKLTGRTGDFVPLLAGDVQWPEVMAAFRTIGYRGSMCAEYSHDPSNPDQVRQISEAVDRILAMG